MKFIHISDLHIGKTVNGFSMLEDQRHILNQIIEIMSKNAPACMLICGDVYDKADPSAEAVSLFDDFLTKASKSAQAVFIISGNHDSPARLAYASELVKKSNIYISPVFDGKITPVTLTDEFGKIDIYMLPFIKKINVKLAYNTNPATMTEALNTVISSFGINKNNRNILLSHQFVTGSLRSDSEAIFVGTADNADVSVYAPFDYTALGHLHSPQNAAPNVRYCGTPLKYSFSEVNHKKSVTVAELNKKGSLEISTVPLSPLRNMRILKGSYGELTLRENYENTPTDDYLQIFVTDETPVPDAIGRLRTIYPNIMQVICQSITESIIPTAVKTEEKSPLTYFEEFFEKQQNKNLTKEQKLYITNIIKELQGG